MAGEDPTGGFDADGFRQGIRQAMTMAIPQTIEQRPTFHFPDLRTHAAVDSGGAPWDPQTSVGAGDPPLDPVQVTCLVTTDPEDTGYVPMGSFESRQATIYLFEDEWDAVHGATAAEQFNQVEVNGVFYRRGPELEPIALFDVTLRVVTAIASDL